jgi:ABC-type enterochelin transport system ATPase subunit
VTPPLESESDARALPEVRAVYDLAHTRPPGWRAQWDRQCQAMITDACEGLDLGEWELRIISRLSGEPKNCAAIANVIRTARENGRR